MKQVKWDLSIGSMVEVDAENLINDGIECQLLSLSLHTSDLVIGLVRYRLLAIKESLLWTRMLHRHLAMTRITEIRK